MQTFNPKNAPNAVTSARFTVLDSWRGLLALLVAFGHLAHWTHNGAVMPLAYVLAVDAFFVLSGFVIVNSMYKKGGGSVWLQRFAVRRVFRIFPVYFLALALAVLALPTLIDPDILASDLPTQLHVIFLMQSTGIPPDLPFKWYSTSAGVAWTLSVEIWLGITFFAILNLIRTRRLMVVGLLGVAILVSMIILLVGSVNYIDVHLHRWGFITMALTRGLLGFSLGVLAFLAYQASPRLPLATVLEVAIVTFIVWLYYFSGIARPVEYLGPFLAALMIYIFAFEGGVISRLLSTLPFRLIGAWSFGIYIFHPTLIATFMYWNWGFAPIQITLFVASVLAVSALAHYTVEKPFIRLGGHISRRIGTGVHTVSVPINLRTKPQS